MATPTVHMITSLLTTIINDSVDQSHRKGLVGKKRAGGKEHTRTKYLCIHLGCRKERQRDFLCVSHGASRYYCKETGCKKTRLTGGFCRKHGSKAKKCKVRNCNRNSKLQGFCRPHSGIPLEKCEIEGCQSNSRGKLRRCKKHGAKSPKCSIPGCVRVAMSKGVCHPHGAPKRRCSDEGCIRYAVKDGVCEHHGAPSKQCKYPGCKKRRQEKGLCVGHGARPCTTEGCPGNIYQKDPEKKLCYSCFCIKYNVLPVNVKLREKYFNNLMNEDFEVLEFNYNKSQPNNCKQTRYPDWSKDFGSFLLVVECDEKQHRGKSYQCETKRTVQIYQNTAYRPTVFIRFNPDGYIDSKKKRRGGCFRSYWNKAKDRFVLSVYQHEANRRWKAIKKQIEFYTKNLENPPTKAITVHKLFYDGYE